MNSGKIDVPFYRSRGYRCAQAAMKSVLKFAAPDKDFSFQVLDDVTGRRRDELTYPVQIADGLEKLGVEFLYFAKEGLLDLTESRLQGMLERHYGDFAEKIWLRTNKASVIRAAENVRMGGAFIQREPSAEDLRQAMADENPPVCLVNYDILKSRGNRFSGHYIVLCGQEDGSFYYHDSGPKEAAPFKSIKIPDFEKAWKNMCPLDYGTIIIIKPSEPRTA